MSRRPSNALADDRVQSFDQPFHDANESKLRHVVKQHWQTRWVFTRHKTIKFVSALGTWQANAEYKRVRVGAPAQRLEQLQNLSAYLASNGKIEMT
eukprot:9096549-Pyramimonas_sp.AAC.2